MKIECAVCGTEFDSENGMCPACGSVAPRVQFHTGNTGQLNNGSQSNGSQSNGSQSNGSQSVAGNQGNAGGQSKVNLGKEGASQTDFSGGAFYQEPVQDNTYVRNPYNQSQFNQAGNMNQNIYSDPYSNQTNSYNGQPAGQPNSYGGQSNSYGNQQNSYGNQSTGQPNPYGGQPNPYGNAGNSGAYAAAPVKEKKSSKNTLALVFGILGILLSCCGGIFGLISSIVAIIMGATVKKDGQSDGKGKAGFVLGIVGAVLSAIGLIVTIVTLATGTLLGESISDIDDDIFGSSSSSTSYATDYDNSYADPYNGYDPSVTEDLDYGDDSTQTNDVDGGDLTYMPDYDIEIIGSYDAGYTYKPVDFYDFQESGGTGFTYSEQYTNGVDIINLSYEPYTEISDYDYATNWTDSLNENTSVLSIQTGTDTHNGIEGYTIFSEWDDGMYMYQWIFTDDDGGLHYLSVEYTTDDSFSDIWETFLYNYTLDK